MGQTLLSWTWWTRSTHGLVARIIIGAAIFAVLATVDLVRRGKNATRWREYLFLIAGVAMACGYGIINDLITSRTSWEYFYYGKGLADVLGPHTPPDSLQLAKAAAKIGIEATWSAGLIIGAALLIANNPHADRPQLCYPKMIHGIGMIAVVTLASSLIFGLLGYLGALSWISADFQWMARENIFRPRRFLCVFGVHLGAYLGGVTGLIVRIRQISQQRRSLRASHPD